MQGGRDVRIFLHCGVCWEEDEKILYCTKTDLAVYTLGVCGNGWGDAHIQIFGRQKEGWTVSLFCRGQKCQVSTVPPAISKSSCRRLQGFRGE